MTAGEFESLLLEGFFFGVVTELFFDGWDELDCVRMRGPVGDPKSAAEELICV